MFGVIRQAGLSPAEFASMVGVKRVAVYNWVAGRSTPHRLVADRVSKTLRVIKKLIEMKKLPLSEELDRETRKEKLRKLKEIIEQRVG